MTTIRQFSRIALAMLTMTGRVTMLGISRWTADGGSYRTVVRFFHTVLPWATLLWLFFRAHLFDPNDVYILGGDETVVTKSGKKTHGVDRFFSSIYDAPVPGLAFFTLSLISTKLRKSFPIAVEQVVRTPQEKAAAQAKAAAKPSKKRGGRPKGSTTKPKAAAKPALDQPAKKRGGRPKGSTTKPKTEVVLTKELTRIQSLVLQLLERIAGLLPVTYLVMDGHFGNNNAVQMARQCGLQLISKLRSDSALYLPYDEATHGRKRRQKYGERINPRAMPERFERQKTVKKGIETHIYQLEALHETFAHPLNVVVIVKTNLKTKAQAHVLLFTSDLTLSWDKLLDYYCLRFQLEFNFRDAKQYWGLEDFQNITPEAVTNAANLSLFLVNLVERVLQDIRRRQPECSVLDLKAHCHGTKYVEETIKLLPEKPDPVLLEQILTKIVGIGRIHALPADPVPA